MLTLTSPRSSSVLRWFVLSLFALLAAVSLVAWSADAARAAQVPPRPDSGAVLDQADILSDADEQRLNDQIGRLNGENDHVRVAILTVDGVDGNFESFTRQTATEWGVGDAGKNNGVLIAADMNDRDLRIEVADGAREVLSNSRAQDIMRDDLTPGFKDEQYAQAFTKTVDAVYADATPDAAAQRAEEDRAWTIGVLAFAGLAAVVVIVLLVRWSRTQKRIRQEADGEIERYLREHPGEEISDEVRKKYYKYRSNHRKPPKDSQKPPKAKDQDGVERDVQYASTFQSWLPLYVMYPAIYSGTNHSISSSGSSGSAGTSFGGGGGFSGGGASGSF